jgi:F-type H+-transporting ATPase subunit b
MINIYTFIFQITNFIVLFLVMRRFLFKPVTEFMEKRSLKIKNDIEGAQAQKAEAEQIKEKYNEKLKEIKQRAAQIIAKAERQGEEKRQDILKQAKQEAVAMQKRALDQIEAEKQKALRDLRGQIIALSVAIAEKIIERSIRPEDHRRLVDNFLEKMAGDIQWRKRLH